MTKKRAVKQKCTCKENGDVVYIDTVEAQEFPDGVSGFYCKDCNSFWREP